MRRFQLNIILFIFTITMLSGCTSKASPAASIAPASDSTQADSYADYFTYTNPSLGFSLELPASWNNKYSVEEFDNYAVFLHKESIGKSSAQGQLFAIIRYPGKMTNEQAQNGAGMRSLVFTTDQYSYVLAYPSGVEYTDETEADYSQMSADIAAISETVKEYSNESAAEKQLYTGYIALEGNVLKLDDFEFIESEDGDRIKELGLTAKDMPNGYYILNTSEDIKDFTVDNNTEYTFYDTGTLFVQDKDGDRIYSTKSKQEFMTFLYGDGEVPLKSPFEVVTQGDKVTSVKEIFVN
ncbi:hypothetical protein [Paenibacillus tepidiphilus]|uniref:hypothetical protein n=1 Tax=Paenibacillus tepidiphilus TaxID=2608683 RepID=UPI00123B224D|nr:hypothetical protein [Paenibacillus tepidiphilus]